VLEFKKDVRHARHSRRGAGTGQRDRGAAEPVAEIRDAQIWEQTTKTERLQSGEAKSEHDGEREHGDWKKNITPLNAGHFVLFGSLIVLWLALGAVYWLLVMAWLYKSAVCEGMNKSLWPIFGLFFNIFAVFAFLIARDRPGRVKLEGASAQ